MIFVGLEIHGAQDLISSRECFCYVEPAIQIQLLWEHAASRQVPEVLFLLGLDEELDLPRATRVDILNISVDTDVCIRECG